MKKFIEKIKNGIKKLFELITNKWLLKGTTTVALVAIVIACYIGLNLAVEKLTIEDLDLTTKKLYSLSDETKKRLNELDANITIQLINMSEDTYVVEYANKYKNASDKVTVEEIDELESRIDLQTKYNINSTESIIVVKNGDVEKVLTSNDLVTYDYATYEQIDVTEEAITNAIVEVTIDEKPQIYVFNGNTYNPVEASLGVIANALIDEANDMHLLDILTEGRVPENCDCLIMTTLKQDLSELERDKILEYINNGGKLLILSSQNIIKVETPNFDQILAQYGITMPKGIVYEQESNKMLYDTPNMIVTNASAGFMSDIDMSLRLFLANAGRIRFANETKLEELGVTYETIASTSESSFVRTDFSQESKSRTDKDSEVGSSIVGAHITKKLSEDKSSQLIIYSNETFASTSQVIIGYQSVFAVSLYNNEDVVLNSVSHLTERDDTITIRKSNETEHYTVTDQEDAVIKTIIFVVPILIIGAGIVVMFIRKRAI